MQRSRPDFATRRSLAPLLLAVLILMAATMSACSRNRSEESSSAAPTAASSVDGAKATGASARTDRALGTRNLDEGRVRKLVDAWLGAQNAGDLHAYEKLFATRFTGVKRVGSRTFRFDRAGWLTDRKNLFGRDFVVRLDDVKVTTSAGFAVVQFTQTWKSPTFEDVGPKRLTVVEEGGALRIASEEMLDSKLVSEREAHDFEQDPSQFAFVKRTSRGPAVVLINGVDVRGATGHPEYVAPTSAERPIVGKTLPGPIRAFEGKVLDLYGSGGKLCEAKVKGFFALVDVQPHFGTINIWEGRDGPKTPPAERALDLWRLSEMGGRFTMAELERQPACQGALWARVHTDTPGKVWTSREPTADEIRAGLLAARKSPAFRALQTQFVSAGQGTKPWDESGPENLARMFEDGQGQRYLAMTLRGGDNQGCDTPFDEQLWVLLKARGSSFIVVSGAPADHVPSAYPRVLEPFKTETAFDLEGDGVPEFLGGDDFYRSVGGSHRSTLNVSPSYYDCPC